jgi:hypothetical protein
MREAAKTISLTEAQCKALVWAINVWSIQMDHFEQTESPTKIANARKALDNVYEKLDPIENWLPQILEKSAREEQLTEALDQVFKFGL